MPRSPIGIGVVIGAALGLILGVAVVLEFDLGGDEVRRAVLTAAIFFAGVGLVFGAMVGAFVQLVIVLSSAPRKVPTDGPEADYHDLPPEPGRRPRT
jgi:hypothetical protein